MGDSILELIRIKTKGERLTDRDIRSFVRKIVANDVEGEQLGAFLMAIKWKGLDRKETTCLTDAMVKSGEVMTWPDSWKGKIVDKHSTGGVGDKVSLVLVPILTCCGVKIPMVSGRGLGFTGGTLDKLESIPGVSVSFNVEDIKIKVEEVGCCIVGQTDSLVPADKLLYSIRDVTNTVDTNGLIASSIVGKKAAERVDHLILDVKCGEAAIYKDEEKVEGLAKLMVDISNGLGIDTMALITKMDHPIGLAIGNSLEIVESLRCLRWNCPVCGDRNTCIQCRGCEDIRGLVYELGGRLLFKAGVTNSLIESRNMMKEKIQSGEALDCFRRMIISQGASEDTADRLCDSSTDFRAGLPKARKVSRLKLQQDGYVHVIDALKCGKASWKLGAGRTQSKDILKLGVGLELQICLGDKVRKGDVWVNVHHDSETIPGEVTSLLETAIEVKGHALADINGSRVMKVIPSENDLRLLDISPSRTLDNM
ncbi:thymidine phosphorylase-like [Argopecten irradians]|uniref:thymidine phosphorylase-like n=1 Tax=Argopecten irradians TaxID=31199 RepID=UPI00371FF667